MIDTGSRAEANQIFQKAGLARLIPFCTILSVLGLILSLAFDGYAQNSINAGKNDLLVELQKTLIESDDSCKRAEAARALGQLASGKAGHHLQPQGRRAV